MRPFAATTISHTRHRRAERDSLNKAEILVRQDFVIQAHASFYATRDDLAAFVDPPQRIKETNNQINKTQALR
jgi:hypothetical protein